jgi:oligopeptide/dipeptide ABC transporter ATP-binding protein
MYGGKLVENAPADDLFGDPAHPYARGLLKSTPRLDMVLPRLVAIDGAPPDMLHPPPGCPFAPRCPVAMARCSEEMPPLLDYGPRRLVACWKAFADADQAAPAAPVPAGSQA